MVRESIHNKIDELLELLSINNTRLSLHSEGLSMLDIDVLRKQCIELYEQVNKLALQPRSVAKTVTDYVHEKPLPKVEEVKVDIPQPQAEAKIEEVIPPMPPEAVVVPAEIVVEPKVEIPAPQLPVQKVEESPIVEVVQLKEPVVHTPHKVVAKSKDKVKSHRHEDEEMKSLFEKFSNKPIESIAKSISIAKRFEFQTAFFTGEAKEYNTFMSLIDGANDREEAFAIYHAYKAKFKWENEELKDELKALMYRKYH